MPTGPLVPGSQHLRRESSHSQHSDMSNHGMGPNSGRGGFSQGRGRGGYTGQQYGHQTQPMSYSPQPGYRQTPNQPGNRGGMPPYQSQQPQNRSFSGYPNSPHPSTRSPVPPHAQPVHLQPSQMSMQNHQMGGYGYPHPGQYAPYATQMAPTQVAPKFSSVSKRTPHRKPFKRDSMPSIAKPSIDLAPHTGNFERMLGLTVSQAYAMANQYGADPAYQAQYMQYFGQYPPQMQGMPPQSPRPPNQMLPPTGQGPYGPHYHPQAPPSMSRTSSALSGADRPGSGMGSHQASGSTPAPTGAVAPPPGGNVGQSPAPKPVSSNFELPKKKSAGIVIKNPNSGETIDLKKHSASPAPSSKSPANVSAAPTPPPRAPSQDPQHVRTESKSVKTDEEKRAEMREAISRKVEADKLEEQRKKDEAADAELRLQKENEEAEVKQSEAATASAQSEPDPSPTKDVSPGEEISEPSAATPAATPVAIEEPESEEARKSREAAELEAEIARWEAEDAEKQRKEEEANKAYEAKKQAEKDEASRKEAEAFKLDDEEMKRLEREAEAAEQARDKPKEVEDENETNKEHDDGVPSPRRGESPMSTGTPVVQDTPQGSGFATPVSEASSAVPKSASGGGKQKPSALKLETNKSVEPPQATPQLKALRSAAKLTSINDVSYPPSINSPNPALNAAAPTGKFKYDRDFLLQFQAAFTEKPSENWSERIKETLGDGTEPSSARATPARGAPPSGSMGSRQTSNRGPLPPPQAMGAFGQGVRTLPPGTTSQDRFQASSRGTQPARPTMQNPLAGFVSRPGAFPQPPGSIKMDRTPSSTSMAHPNSPRNASQRGGSQRGSRAAGRREDPKDNKTMPLTAGANIKPIEVTSGGWKPRSVGAAAMAGPAPGGEGHMGPDVVQRKVKSNLNKMTPNNFDKISGQILEIAHQSKNETDGRSLRQVIQLTFEKATDEAHWAEMYAQFCHRMLESMSPEIKDESIRDKKGDLVTGGHLFRKYLLTRCQTEFERGWKVNLPEMPDGTTEEAALLSDEYYTAAAAKRRGLGLVRFIGELYKLGMLTERIMHECVKKLVDYEGVPDEAEVESLTKLLGTIGEQLDNSEKGRQMMDAYFARIGQMVDIPNLASRLRFMLMDTVDLRRAGWKSKSGGVKGPTTLDAVRHQVSVLLHKACCTRLMLLLRSWKLSV